ncbi:uncharacterized protein TNCV_2765321 [Trichonephila clavipes]|nr:uncharacterized protein TNCV_2765321 [Trichonephila clavipes]
MVAPCGKKSNRSGPCRSRKTVNISFLIEALNGIFLSQVNPDVSTPCFASSILVRKVILRFITSNNRDPRNFHPLWHIGADNPLKQPFTCLSSCHPTSQAPPPPPDMEPSLRTHKHVVVATVAEWYRYWIVACLVTSSSPVPLKTRRVGQRCTLNLSRAETSSRWCGVVVRRGGASSGVVHVT